MLHYSLQYYSNFELIIYKITIRNSEKDRVLLQYKWHFVIAKFPTNISPGIEFREEEYRSKMAVVKRSKDNVTTALRASDNQREASQVGARLKKRG